MKMTIGSLFLILILSACNPGPQDVTIGHDECAHCRMIISERPFASQIVSTTGKVWFFDSVECLAAYEIADSIDEERVHSRWVPNFNNPEEWLEAETSFYLHSINLRSPMGLHLSSYKNKEDANEKQQEFEGEILNWDDVKLLTWREWFN